jgi:hypothetical protein
MQNPKDRKEIPVTDRPVIEGRMSAEHVEFHYQWEPTTGIAAGKVDEKSEPVSTNLFSRLSLPA